MRRLCRQYKDRVTLSQGGPDPRKRKWETAREGLSAGPPFWGACQQARRSGGTLPASFPAQGQHVARACWYQTLVPCFAPSRTPIQERLDVDICHLKAVVSR